MMLFRRCSGSEITKELSAQRFVLLIILIRVTINVRRTTAPTLAVHAVHDSAVSNIIILDEYV